MEKDNLIKPTIAEIFRIENQETMHGMWYNEKGEYDPFIFNLTEGISADLPMGYHERYGQDAARWFSGCVDFEQMKHWFSERDIRELDAAGYHLYKFEAKQFQHEEFQTIFTREGIVQQTLLPMDDLLK